ncbi:hypothetical protein [Novosphingobium beihaiensis]|uniref:HEXXH motif-containing protein n=1 Tax=Novosphingobium beihaiensis TaxID=2930389 RepID=A0ABT0BVT6_9SPHN|nr:hypothetical protein [Novosphingobium beihaiensis]MCJ2189053.1 hypothetical protein [Novosphingobium beihaiensis]
MGRSSAPIIDQLVADFTSRVNGELVDLLWQISARGLSGGNGLRSAIADLSQERRASFLLDPDFFSALRTARGLMSPESFALLEAVVRAPTPYRSDDLKKTEITTVGDVIRVDLRSESSRRLDQTSPIFFKPFEDPSLEESRDIVRKIEDAVREIDRLSPAFGRLIRNYTRRVYVRKVDSEPPASEQVDSEIGSIRLRNMHSNNYTHEQVMDDLIHESVHNYLGSFEYVKFPFVRFAGENNRSLARPVSPWSLRPIQMLPFLHAAFVYFAIYHFALVRCECTSAGTPARRSALRQRNRYSSGFLMPGKLSSYVAGQADVDPRVLGALDWMQEFVRQDVSRHAGYNLSISIS